MSQGPPSRGDLPSLREAWVARRGEQSSKVTHCSWGGDIRVFPRLLSCFLCSSRPRLLSQHRGVSLPEAFLWQEPALLGPGRPKGAENGHPEPPTIARWCVNTPALPPWWEHSEMQTLPWCDKSHRCPHPNPWNLRLCHLAQQWAIKAADGIKVANQLTLRWEAYSGLSGWPQYDYKRP